ncbi:MAG: LarC family nickel insertion protein [Clostridia bacterium]|nr:LarC family nickel insertion protein [Clostridia bacterium]
MKTIYLDCSMGVSADRLASVLYELTDDKDSFIKNINSAGLKGVRVAARKEIKGSLEGTRLSVRIMESGKNAKQTDSGSSGGSSLHKHRNRSLHDIEEIISELRLSPKVQKDVVAIYKLIANAKSQTHGKAVSDIHLHKDGARDTIANITMVSMLIEQIAAQKILSSPINIGSDGQSDSATSVPTPTMLHILRGMPIYSENAGGQSTPAGAALLKYYVNEFGNMPVIKTEKVGYGMGSKNSNDNNYIRAILGEMPDKSSDLSELHCAVNDMTAEQIAYAMQIFFDAGAIEAYTMPIGMKNSRAGTLICVVCDSEEKEKFIPLIFKHTSTTNIKESLCRNYALSCREETKNSSIGPVKKEIAQGYGVVKTKYNFDDLVEIAEKYNMSVSEVLKHISI